MMIEPREIPAQPLLLNARGEKQTPFRLPPPFIFSAIALVLCFAVPLYRWFRFGLQSDLYSYILLVPLISGYLIWQKRRSIPRTFNRSYTLGLVFACLGAAVLAGYGFAILSGAKLEQTDLVALSTLSFLLLFAAVCALFLGESAIKTVAFPLIFLLFMIPFPGFVERSIEGFLQRGSAPPAYWLFKIVGTPLYREGLIFQLPGMTLQIAPECSGIRSSLVLFITSLVAGYLFLKSPWKRAILSIAVIPLALVRNGFRVFTIGELCVHVGPHMIDSPIHHHGGPIFFALSLVPFSILTFCLVKSDRASAMRNGKPAIKAEQQCSP
jgi:exosortase C (VPDSG-CTERM-specific)